MTVTTAAVATPPMKKAEPDGVFAGMPYFEIPDSVFQKRLMGKMKTQHWRKFLEDDASAERIRQYIRRTNNRKFLLKRAGVEEYINVKGWM